MEDVSRAREKQERGSRTGDGWEDREELYAAKWKGGRAGQGKVGPDLCGDEESYAEWPRDGDT